MPINDPNDRSADPLPEESSPAPEASEASAVPDEPSVETPLSTNAAAASENPVAEQPAQAQPATASNALAGVVVDPSPRHAANLRSTFGERPGWLALAIAVILSTALTMGILAAANRGLLYASAAQTLALQAKVDTLQSRLDTQEQDLIGLRARLDAVEKLAWHASTLEQDAQNLRSELEKRTADLETLRSLVNEIQKQIEQVITQSSAFETFVNGMRNVLDKLPIPRITQP